jgi:hypothetical protein
MRQRIPQNGAKLWQIANYGEPKGKIASTTTGITKQLERHPVEPEAKKTAGTAIKPKGSCSRGGEDFRNIDSKRTKNG